MSPDETDLIVKHSLTSKENLSVAIKVGLALPTLRHRIFAKFLHHLREQMQNGLPESWVTEIELEAWVGISIRRKKWPEEPFVGVGSDSASGKNEYFWVYRIGEVVGNRLLDEPLKSDLEDRIGKSRSTREPIPSGPLLTTLWWMYPNRYRNWDSEETLLELYGNEQAVEYYKKQLIDIVEVVTQVIGP